MHTHRGAVGGSVPCSRVSPQSWYWRWRERSLFTPPTDNSCRTWDSNPQPRVTSPTLYPLGHDCPYTTAPIFFLEIGLPSHVIFNLLQEIKDDLEPSTRSHALPGLSKHLANLHFLASGSFRCTVAPLFLYSLFATTLICAVLGILRWSVCKWDVASLFFHLRIVSKSPAEISPPIGAVFEFLICPV